MAAALRHRTPKSLSFPRAFSAQPLADLDPQAPTKPETVRQTFSRLSSAIRSEPDPDRIFSLFQSSTSHPRFYYQIPLHQQTVTRLTLLRRPDLVERILEAQKSDPKAPKSEGFLIRLISLYASSGMLDHARRTFDEMPQRTERSFSALLSACLANDRPDLVAESFNSIPKRLGITPDSWAYNIYLKSLCKKGEIENALKVLDKMPEPNIISYNTILDGCLKSGDLASFEKILKIVVDKKLEANVVTYNIRIRMFCYKSESYKAEQVLGVMATKNVKPELTSFNTVIDGYCKEGEVGSAVRVFERLKGTKGLKPSAKMYMALLKSLVEKGEFASGLEVFRECLVRKLAPPFEPVKGLVEGLVKDAKGEVAKEVVAKMKGVVKGDAVEAWKKLEDELEGDAEEARKKLLGELVKIDAEEARKKLEGELVTGGAEGELVKGDAAEARKKLEGELVKGDAEEARKKLEGELVNGDAAKAWKKLEGELAL